MSDDPEHRTHGTAAEHSTGSSGSPGRPAKRHPWKNALLLISVLGGIVLIAVIFLPDPAPGLPLYAGGACYTPPGGMPPDYHASPARRAAILSGLPQLAVGMSRQQVRNIMGDPDVDKPSYVPSFMHPKNGVFTGIFWHNILYSVKPDGANMRDDVVLVYFTPEGKLKNASRSGGE